MNLLEFSIYVSADGEQGASESDNMILGFEASYDNQEGSVWYFALQGDLQRSENRTFERSYEASLDYAKAYVNRPWGWYAGIAYEADAFLQDIEKEITAVFGVSLDLFDYIGKDKQIDDVRFHDLQFLLSTIYSSSEDAQGVTENAQGITLGYDYSYESKDRYEFSQAFAYEFYPDEDEFDAIVLENSVEFPFSANQNLKLKIGLDYEYYPNVSAGSEDYELSYYSNIVWNF